MASWLLQIKVSTAWFIVRYSQTAAQVPSWYRFLSLIVDPFVHAQKHMWISLPHRQLFVSPPSHRVLINKSLWQYWIKWLEQVTADNYLCFSTVVPQAQWVSAFTAALHSPTLQAHFWELSVSISMWSTLCGNALKLPRETQSFAWAWHNFILACFMYLYTASSVVHSHNLYYAILCYYWPNGTLHYASSH